MDRHVNQIWNWFEWSWMRLVLFSSQNISWRYVAKLCPCSSICEEVERAFWYILDHCHMKQYNTGTRLDKISTWLWQRSAIHWWNDYTEYIIIQLGWWPVSANVNMKYQPWTPSVDCQSYRSGITRSWSVGIKSYAGLSLSSLRNLLLLNMFWELSPKHWFGKAAATLWNNLPANFKSAKH